MDENGILCPISPLGGPLMGWDIFLVDVITGGEKGSDGSMNSDDELHQHEL